MADQEEVPICTGEDLAVVVPSPNCPLPFPPQAYKAPVVKIPNEKAVAAGGEPPAAMADQEDNPICTGEDLAVVVPSPNAPTAFNPQAYKAPVDKIPIECQTPAATADQEEVPI